MKALCGDFEMKARAVSAAVFAMLAVMAWLNDS
jgi:hypothetical protein